MNGISRSDLTHWHSHTRGNNIKSSCAKIPALAHWRIAFPGFVHKKITFHGLISVKIQWPRYFYISSLERKNLQPSRWPWFSSSSINVSGGYWFCAQTERPFPSLRCSRHRYPETHQHVQQTRSGFRVFLTKQTHRGKLKGSACACFELQNFNSLQSGSRWKSVSEMKAQYLVILVRTR